MNQKKVMRGLIMLIGGLTSGVLMAHQPRNSPDGRRYYDELLNDALSVPKHVAQAADLGIHSEIDCGHKISRTCETICQGFDSSSDWTGRSYYDSLIDKALERNAVVSAEFYYDIAYDGFDANGLKTSLSGMTFGAFQIKDVFLLAKLAFEGKLHIQTPPPPPNPQFGNAQGEQWLNLISQTNVEMNVDQQSFACDLTAMYRFKWCDYEKIWFTLGLSLPIKSVSNSLLLSFDGGKLYQAGFTQLATQRETTLFLFHKDFISIEDFFIRAVLIPKGITFLPYQRTVGIGDLSLFAIADAGGCANYIDALQFGLNLVLPTAKKTNGSILFQPELGNGGGIRVDVFSNIIFNLCNSYFNPTIRIAGEFCAGSFTSTRRVPQLKTQATEGLLRDNPTLLVPIYREYRTDPFTELDSTVPGFADAAFAVNTKTGTQLDLGLGNYFYDVFNSRFRLGVFYDYLRKNGDTITAKSGTTATLNIAAVTANTSSNAHRFGWNLAYKAENLMEIELGSQHIFAGKNVSRLHEFFVTLVAVF